MCSNADYLDIQIFTKGNDKYLFSRITNCFNNPTYNIIVFNFNRVKKKKKEEKKKEYRNPILRKRGIFFFLFIMNSQKQNLVFKARR